VRIIAGEWKGRRIATPKGGHVRPTADRVREAWMSMVQPSLPGARVLDLCAGSGALGLEALSRGAAFVEFVEQDPRSLRTLRENIALLGADVRCAVHRADAVAWAEHEQRAGAAPRDVAFADPPYHLGVAKLLAQRWLSAPFAAIFGVEHEAREALPEGGDTRRYGDTAVTIYRT
jgi:16S rRNA (guanine966-N2)-methyltransferase